MSFEHNPTLYFLEHPQEESVLVISKICIKMDQVGDLATKCPTDKRPHQSGDRLHCATHTLPYSPSATPLGCRLQVEHPCHPQWMSIPMVLAPRDIAPRLQCWRLLRAGGICSSFFPEDLANFPEILTATDSATDSATDWLKTERMVGPCWTF